MTSSQEPSLREWLEKALTPEQRRRLLQALENIEAKNKPADGPAAPSNS